MRKKTAYFLFLLLLFLDVLTFLMEKYAVLRAGEHGEAVGVASFFKSLLSGPWVWLTLAIGPLQLWTWTRILSKFDLSLAYPMSSLNMPLTLLASHWLLREPLPWQVWTGGLLVTAGAALVSGRHPPDADPAGGEPKGPPQGLPPQGFAPLPLTPP